MMAPQYHRVLGPCPTEADLICATSGELPPEEFAVVRQHLAHCPDCPPRMREILETLNTCAQLANTDSPSRLQAGRERLEDLMAAARADREAMSPRRWLAVAAVLIVFVVGIALFRTDRLDADEVVRRAANHEPAITMPADLWRWTFIPGGDGQTSTNAAPPPQAVQVLQAHGFDLANPLSLVRLQAWRDSQPDRRERLTHRDGWYVVTATTSGPLREVELVINKSNYQLVKQTWLIAGMGRVVCERVRLDRRSGVSSQEIPRSEPGR